MDTVNAEDVFFGGPIVTYDKSDCSAGICGKFIDISLITCVVDVASRVGKDMRNR